MLDLGCGTGELARTAAAAGMRVVACDISRAMLRHAAAGDAKGLVEWIRLEPAWRTLPFVSTAFDAIIAASVLEYVDKPRELMHECARVLRPGGVMLCTVPNLTHPVRLLEWPATMVVRGPRVRTLCSRSRRLDAYLTYLTISRHRHSVQWSHDRSSCRSAHRFLAHRRDKAFVAAATRSATARKLRASTITRPTNCAKAGLSCDMRPRWRRIPPQGRPECPGYDDAAQPDRHGSHHVEARSRPPACRHRTSEAAWPAAAPEGRRFGQRP